MQSAEAALTATIILLQSHVDEAFRSRVIGLWFMVSQLSNLSLLAVGPLAERYGLDARGVGNGAGGPVGVSCPDAALALG